MPNKHYMKGYRKERKLVNEAREKGLVAFRSAGSHSPIDVMTINHKTREIELVQSKSDLMTDSAKQRLEWIWDHLDGVYTVKFIIK